MCTSPNNYYINESMVSLVLRQYMRGKNGTESLVVFFPNVVQWRSGLSCLFEQENKMSKL